MQYLKKERFEDESLSWTRTPIGQAIRAIRREGVRTPHEEVSGSNPYDIGDVERVWDGPAAHRAQETIKPVTKGPEAEFKMEYRDVHGTVSRRNISNLEFRDEFGILYLTAFCHRARDSRSFRVDRILSLTALTGEVRQVDPKQLARRALGLDIPDRILEEFEPSLEIIALIAKGRASAEVLLPTICLAAVARHIMSQSQNFDDVAPYRMQTHVARLRLKTCTLEIAAARMARLAPPMRRELTALTEHILDLIPEKKRKLGDQLLALLESQPTSEGDITPA